MSETLSPPRADARRIRKQRARELARAAKAAAMRETAVREEAAAEEIAPAIQRKAVVGGDGEVYRHAMLVRDGITFRRGSPVAALFQLGSVNIAQLRAAERLARAWEDGGRGVGRASAAYGERTSAAVQSGYISDRVLAALGYQNRQKAEFEGALAWLGGLGPAVCAVALEGLSVAAWGRRAGLTNGQVALGYVKAGLDRLVEFYRAVEAAKEKPGVGGGVRSVVVVERGG